MKSNKVNFKLVNLLVIIAIIYLLQQISGLWIGLVVDLFKIVAPFIVAFGVAYITYPIVKKLIDAGSPKWLAILSILILGIGIIVIILLLTIPLLYEQILLFVSNISVFLSDLGSKFSINFGPLQNSLTDFSSDIIKNLGNLLSNGAINVVNTSVSFISTFVVIICASVYILVDMDKIRVALKKNLLKNHKRLFDYLVMIDGELSKYICGMGLSILIQIAEYSFAFLIIGHPNWLILGIISGLSAIIPWFGGFIVAVLSLLVSSVISTKMFLLTVLICLICPVLDGNVIGPKVFGKTNKIHPVTTIFAVSAGGIIGGFWGIVLSLPTAIVVIATYKFFKNDINKKIQDIRKEND